MVQFPIILNDQPNFNPNLKDVLLFDIECVRTNRR